MYRLTSKVTTNPVNQAGLIAGALGGESIVLVVLANTLILRYFTANNLPPDNPTVVAWNAVYPFLIIAIFEGWGVFSAWLGAADMKSTSDAFFAGFIAGILIGVLLEIMWIAQLASMVSHQLSHYISSSLGYGNGLVTIAALVVFAILGGVLSGFGSYIFYIFRKSPENQGGA